MPNGVWPNIEYSSFKPPHYLQACTKNLPNMEGVGVYETTNSQPKGMLTLMMYFNISASMWNQCWWYMNLEVYGVVVKVLIAKKISVIFLRSHHRGRRWWWWLLEPSTLRQSPRVANFMGGAGAVTEIWDSATVTIDRFLLKSSLWMCALQTFNFIHHQSWFCIASDYIKLYHCLALT